MKDWALKNWETKSPPPSLKDKADSLFEGFSELELEALIHDFLLQARSEQLPPSGGWRTWAFIGGRGAGKTRAGAEWVRGLALGISPFSDAPLGRIALVGETMADVREVMIEGVSGLLAAHPYAERPQYHKSRQVLEWANGVLAQGFSADDPDSLRGPQFHAAWCDELAKWRYGAAAYAMLQFSLRLGARPRALITTTPRPIKLLKDILEDQETAITRATSFANAANLSRGFIAAIEKVYGGTRLGRQELMGEMIEEREDGLFARHLIEAKRVAKPAELSRIVIAIDPPVTSHKHSDACGIIAAGEGADGQFYVLKDASVKARSPTGWARAAINLYHALEADKLIAEVNQGGEMVRTVLNGVDASVPVAMVRASRGKYLRAEPVAALYEQGRISHVGALTALEDEMADFGPEGLSSGKSPDRLDALVWAITALMEGPAPRVRSV